MRDSNAFQLTKNITVGDFKNWMILRDSDSKERIMKLTDHRFQNRYIKHVKEIESGFLKMAIACQYENTRIIQKRGKMIL